MDLINYRQPESAHWYGTDGAPRHDATLREARKELLAPSVTTILGIMAKPGLESWKISQALAQALTMTRDPGEADADFIRRILAADKEERAKAPDLGTAVHAAIAEYIGALPSEPPTVPAIDLTHIYRWIDEHIHPEDQDCLVEHRFYSSLGYGGCIDLIADVDGKPSIVDWKTQAVKKYANFYPEWAWQLAAYSAALPIPAVNLYNVVIDSTTGQVASRLWKQEDIANGLKGFKGLLEAWIAANDYDPRPELPF